MNAKREQITLTPSMAETLLKTNYEKNRKLNNAYAASLARDIESGRWVDGMVNDSIVISDTGKLLDGQHRCKAVIIANKPIVTYLCTNVPETHFKLMDCNKPRNTAQFAHMKDATVVLSLAKYANGIENGVSITSAANGRVAYYGKTGRSVYATRTELLDYLAEHEPQLTYITDLATKMYRAVHCGSKSGYADALWTIAYINGFKNLQELGVFAEEMSKVMPSYEAIAQGKQKIAKLTMDAKANGVRASAVRYLGLVLATYDQYVVNGKFPRANAALKAVEKYDKILASIRNDRSGKEK